MIAHCIDCKIDVAGEHLTDYKVEVPDSPIGNLKFSFLKCPNCKAPVLMCQISEIDGQYLKYGKPIQLYPDNSIQISIDIPEDIRDVLNEAVKCFKTNAFMASAIMCRKVIEVYAIAYNCQGKNLAESIKQLHNKKILADQLFEWANQLRLSGNSAAHDVRPDISSKDAQDLLDFTIAILDFTYTFQNKFKEFMNRKNNSQIE